eukprot:gb/GECG01005140.1/.p1 GENE.gb/GECG01005140.1/~~gb/GECG01005140.1/.p1  ORF type:complete len:2574 (+),score=322.80 gb/GECG01005140.1/:1-7722(+)
MMAQSRQDMNHRFQLSPLQSDLYVTFANDDFSEALKVLHKTDLATVEVVDMYEFLEYICSGNCVDRMRFLEQFPDLLESSDEVTVIPLLDSVYKLLDRVSTGWVRIDDLCAALSVYVAGSKSDKLSTLWGLFCSNEEGVLSDAELWRLFRSLLSGIFALSSHARSTAWLTTIRTIDDAAGELVEDLRKHGSHGSAGATFEALGKWYSARAGTVEWMELLDTNKWPQEKPFGTATGTENNRHISQRPPAPPASEVTASAPPPNDDDESDEVLSIDIGDYGDAMVISRNTLQVLQYMHTVVGFNQWRPQDIIRSFSEYERLGGLFKDNFEKCVDQLCSKQLTGAERDRVREFLLQVFDSFDLLDIEQVETKEVACGFLILSKGTKSEKLEAAFKLFAEDAECESSANITVSRSSLFLMIRSFLNMLWIFSDSFDSDTGLASIESCAANFARAALRFSNRDKSTSDTVSFGNFAQWYNSGGCDRFSWIELLDPTKWSLRSTAPSQLLETSQNMATGESSAGITLSFLLTNDGSSLELNDRHADMVREAAQITGLSKITVSSFAQTYISQLLPAADRATRNTQLLVVDKQSFDHFIRAIIPGTGFSKEDKAWLSGLFNTIFWLESHRAVWATGNREQAPVDGIATALSMFVAGSKSEKLTFSFAVFNGDNILQTIGQPDKAERVEVSSKDMERMIGSFLVPIIAVTVSQNKPGVDAWAKTIVQSSCEITRELLSSLENKTAERSVSFEDFRQWYNNLGHQRIPWLELIAFHKWPRQEAETDFVKNSMTSTGKPDSMQNQIAFPFPVLAVSRDGDDRVVLPHEAPSPQQLDEQQLRHPDESGFLYITFDNCRALKEFIRITRLDSNDVGTIVTLLLDRSSSGHISQRSFHKVMRRLIDAQQLEREESVFASRALDRLFMAFDRSKSKAVSFWEFTIGLSIFASGSKSEKLSTAWTLLDDDNDNALKRVQIWRLLRSFLTGIVMVKYFAVEQLSREELASLCEDVDIACVQLTEAAVYYNRKGNVTREVLSFEQFGAWYNEEGFKMAPWLELLDLRKWPKHGNSTGSPSYSVSENEGSITESANQGADEVYDDTLVFNLSSKGHVLSLSDADVNNVSRLLNLSKLGNIQAEKAVEVLLEECVEETLDKGSFNKAMRKLVDVGGMNDQNKKFLSLSLNTFFFAFDQTYEEVVDANEFITGFLLLCGGSKSEKLSVAWELMDSDSDGVLSRHEFFALIRALLKGVLALQGEAQRAAPHTVEEIIEDSCQDVVEDVFSQARIQHRGLSFDAFGEYYNGGGFDRVSWLELLNLSKWGDVVSEALGSSESWAGHPSEAANEDVLCTFDFPHLPSLPLRVSAAELFLSAVHASGFSQYTATELWKKLNSELSANVVENQVSSDEGLIEGIQQLVQHFATEVEESFGSHVTLEYFSIWARFLFRLGLRSYTALKMAMVWLCSGSKSEKLKCCWSLFQKQSLRKDELQTMFVSLIASLYYFGRVLRIGPDSLEKSGETFVDSILSETGKEELSFSDFGEWYNSGGYHRAAWLELLDLRKWAQCVQTPEASHGAPQSEEEGDVHVPINLNLNISLAGKQVREAFTIDPQRMRQVAVFLASSPLASMDITQLHRLLSGSLSELQPDADRFASILKFPADDIFGRDLLRLLHEFVTNICTEEMNRSLALCALTPICHGSKSDKLSYIFSEVGGRQGVTRQQLRRILQSCFSGVSGLCLFLEQQHPDGRRKQDLWNKVRRGVDYAMRSIKDSISSTTLTYDDFGNWYNNQGTTVAPWLEYLDPGKWLFSDLTKLSPGISKNDEEIVIYFGDESSLRIDSATTKKVHALVGSTRLNSRSSMELHRGLQEMEAEDSTLPADAVRSLVNAELGDPYLLKKFVTRVFFALDDESESGGVDAMEFSVAVSLLCSGSKSDKLRSAFAVFGTGEEKSISDAELWRLLVSAVVGIGSAASLVYEEPSEIPDYSIIIAHERSVALSRNVSDAMMELAISIVSECNDNNGEHITWEEFAKWYNDCGGEKASWLELLDVSKWSPSYWNKESGEQCRVENESDRFIFEFNLATERWGKSAVRFTSEDCAAHSRFLKVSDLVKIGVNTLSDAASRVGDITSKREYNALLRLLIPGTDIGEKEKIFLSYHFNRIYQQLCGIFKTPGSLRVLCALSVLCRGSKSEKLLFCWNEACSGDSRRIGSDGILSILGGFLAAVASFSEEFFSRSDGCAVLLAHCNFVVGTLRAQFSEGMSFEEFGGWYNNVGYQLIPWLEFIDTKKWPSSSALDTNTRDGSAGEASDLTFSEHEANDVDSEQNLSGYLDSDVPVFVFDVHVSGIEHTIQFTYGDSENARALRAALDSGILHDTNGLRQLLKSSRSKSVDIEVPDNVLDSQRVQEALPKRIIRKEASPKDTGACSDIVGSLVAYCSALCQVHSPDLAEGSLLAEELACALIILSDCKKSQKLMTAFTEFGILSNSKAFADSHRLSEAEMGRFFASLLLAILSLSDEYRNAGFPQKLAELSLAVGRNIARDIGRCTSSNLKEVRVSYGQMVEWYNTQGYKFIPWLELVDLKKWEGPQAENTSR